MAKLVLLNPPSADATPLVVLSQVVGSDAESQTEPEVMLRLAPGEGRVETLRPGTCLIVVADTPAGLDYFPQAAAPAADAAEAPQGPRDAPPSGERVAVIGGTVLWPSPPCDTEAG